MALTKYHAEDAWLYGKAAFEQFLAQFQAEWESPIAETYMNVAFNMQPPEVQQQLRKLVPGAYDTFTQTMNRKV
jgi:hypothetical protein